MPITPAYTWRESEEDLTVEVALRNISRSQVDILSTECFLKVNSAPYLLQVDLLDEVQAKKSKAVVSETGVTFTLHKVTRGLWGRLTTDLEKPEALKRRQESLEDFREAAGKQKEDARLLKDRTNKLALEKQWALEDAKRQTLEKRKAEELRKAQADLLEWQQRTRGPSLPEHGSFDGEQSGGLEVERPEPLDEGISDDEDTFIPANQGRAAIVEVDDSDDEAAEISSTEPSGEAARSPQTDAPIVVELVPGAGLDSLLHLEEEVTEGEVTLVARSSRRFGPESAGNTPSDAQTKAGHKSAANGVNKEGNAEENNKPSEEVQDSKGGLLKPAAETVLPPPRRKLVVPVQFTAKELRPNVPARESRLKEIELKKAQSVAQDDDSVDISERQPAFLKDKGDALYKAGDYQGAVSAYTRAIEKDPDMALCYSNRSACFLRLGQLDSCLSDCTKAVDLLQQQLEEETDGQDGPTGTSNGHERCISVDSLDPSLQISKPYNNPTDTASASESRGVRSENSKDSSRLEEIAQQAGSGTTLSSEETSNCKGRTQPETSTILIGRSGEKSPSERERIYAALIRVLVRRAAAQCEKGQTAEAIADYRRALKMAPENKGIKNDLQNLEDFLRPPSQSEWKARGDSLYGEGDIEGAVEAYTNGVDCEEQSPSTTKACLSNRSAAYIRLERFHEAEADCSRALALLGYDPKRNEAPNKDTSEGAEIQACLKLLSRRGMVHGHLKQYMAAVSDLEAALALARAANRSEVMQDLERDIKLLKRLNDS